MCMALADCGLGTDGDLDGKLVAQSIDMRTQEQILQMLGQAGLQ
jgi:hypothetical protein